MKAIAAHFRYITKNGRLEIEDDRGAVERGKEALLGIERQWRLGGGFIPDTGHRREAFNIMLSMPRGTDPESVLFAAREFAKVEFADHRYVMVLHDHQANPHVHLTVKAESKNGKRLNPRKADLHRWREVFAEQLCERGIYAEASRQVARGPYRKRDELWQVKAKEEGRLRKVTKPTSSAVRPSREAALEAWTKLAIGLANSERPEDRMLAREIVEFVREGPARSRPEGRLHQANSAARRLERGERAQVARNGKGPEVGR
jgi:hypothetical protein